jgi:hypothetical protein
MDQVGKQRDAQRPRVDERVGCINSGSSCDGLVFVDEATEQVSATDRRRCRSARWNCW